MDCLLRLTSIGTHGNRFSNLDSAVSSRFTRCFMGILHQSTCCVHILRVCCLSDIFLAPCNFKDFLVGSHELSSRCRATYYGRVWWNNRRWCSSKHGGESHGSLDRGGYQVADSVSRQATLIVMSGPSYSFSWASYGHLQLGRKKWLLVALRYLWRG
jgi:hypothetical protein